VRATVSKPLRSVIFWSTLRKSRLCPPSRKRRTRLLAACYCSKSWTVYRRSLSTNSTRRQNDCKRCNKDKKGSVCSLFQRTICKIWREPLTTWSSIREKRFVRTRKQVPLCPQPLFNPLKFKWLPYVPSDLTFKNSKFLHTLRLCEWLWQYLPIISLYSWETELCKVKIGFLNVIHINTTHFKWWIFNPFVQYGFTQISMIPENRKCESYGI